MSKRTIRVVVSVSVALLLAALLAVTASKSNSAAKATTTITFWNGFTGPDRPALEALVKKFNNAHSDINIDMTIMPWDVFYQKLLPSWAARKGPDLIAFDSAQIPQYADKGVLEELDDVYKSGAVPKSKLVPAAVNAGKFNGHYYGIPMNFTTLLLYWNKGMFKKAGINGPPKTWAQWQKDAVKLTIDKNKDGKPEQYGYSIADHATIPMWPILIWGNGGNVVSNDGKKSMLDSPATIKAVDQWAKLVINKHISPIGLAGADADNLFLSKKAAMEVVGPWMTTGFKGAGIKFGLAMVPKGPKRQVTLGTSVAYSVNSKADDSTKKAITEWLKFWSSKPSQISWAVGSGFPPDRTDITAAQLKKNPYVASFGKYAKQSKFYLVGVKKFTEVNGDVFEPAIQKILNKKGSTKSILQQAAKQMTPLLK